jgi:hypothetical protein
MMAVSYTSVVLLEAKKDKHAYSDNCANDFLEKHRHISGDVGLDIL